NILKGQAIERDNDASKICKPAPRWEIKGHGAPMKGLLGNVVVLALLKASLHDKLLRTMYCELKRRAQLYGNKDDFLVYDRCGRLTCHIVLPYSFLHYPNIDAAVRATYHKDIYGNCTMSESRLKSLLSATQFQMLSEGGGNMPNIHHQQHRQHHHHHGSDTDKQDSN
uniref:Selenoprotein P N-terminal domain-containing protein n=1 Tax=Salmo trutta TaxID=8032 RepID=A0A673Y865_SALTR